MKNIRLGYEILQDLIGSKWVPEILSEIKQGSNRYSDILNNIPFMSSTELRRKLRMLQDRNIIIRIEIEHNVTYSLAPFGEDLVHIFQHIEEISEKYVTNKSSQPTYQI